MPFFPPSAPAMLDALNAHDYGALGNGSHDDTAALQAWIDAATSTGRPGYLPAGTYKITAPLVISGACVLCGAGAREVYGPLNGAPSSAAAYTILPTALSGAIITQASAATDVLQITAVGCTVNLKDIGLTFSAPYVNTGHGINAAAPIVTSYHGSGIIASHWSNITVLGHDGNHYAFCITNPNYSRFECLRAYGGGGYYLYGGDDTGWWYGSCTFSECIGICVCAGSADGLHADALYAHGINFVLFEHFLIGVNQTPAGPAAFGATSPTSSQRTGYIADNVVGFTFLHGDFEGNVGSSLLASTSTQLFGAWVNPISGEFLCYYAPNIGQIDNLGQRTFAVEAPAVQAYNSVDTPLANAAVVMLDLNTTRYDQGTTSAQHSTSSQPSRLLCRQTGVYQITAAVQYDSSAAGTAREARVHVNGSLANYVSIPPDPVQYTTVQCLMQWHLSAGDYVELGAYQDSGGSLAVKANAGTPSLAMARVS